MIVMSRKKSNNTITKIEIDEKTNEPVLVQVSLDNVKKDVERSIDNAEIKKADFVEKKSDKSVGKQLVINRVLGFNEEENQANISKRQKHFKIIFSVAFFVFVISVLAFTFYKDFFASGREAPSLEGLYDILKTSWFYLIFAIISLFFCFVFKGLKLSIMCKRLTGKFHLKTCMETGIIGHYYNCVTPLAVGGQPFEIYHLSKHGVHGGAASSMPIAAFFLNQFGFVTLGFVALGMISSNTLHIPETILGVFPETFKFLAIIGLICCLLMPLLILVFSLMPSVGSRLVTFVMWLGGKLRLIKNPKETTYRTIKTVYHNSKCLKKITANPFIFLLTYIVSLCEWLALCSIAYFTLKFFGYDIEGVYGLLEWGQIILLCLILYAAISFIPTPGNSGAADLSFFLLFETGLFAGLAFPAMVIWRSLSFYSFIVIGFVFAVLKKKADHKRQMKIAQKADTTETVND